MGLAEAVKEGAAREDERQRAMAKAAKQASKREDRIVLRAFIAIVIGVAFVEIGALYAAVSHGWSLGAVLALLGVFVVVDTIAIAATVLDE